jgi:hypothetical protein
MSLTRAAIMITKRKKRGRLADPSRAAKASGFDPVMVSELIEACRAHVASLVELAEVTSRTLYDCDEYEADERDLGLRCDRVRHLLAQVQVALMTLGIVSHDTDACTRASDIAKGCEAQQQELRSAVHLVRASIDILRGFEPNHDDPILTALRDLERGIASVVDGLERVIQRCPNTAGTDP